MAFRNLPDMKPTNKPQFAGYGFQFEDGGASAPVQSVNGKTGAVVLDASDVGAPTAESVTASFNSVNGKIGDINDNIAPTESTDIASQAYTVGEYFINKNGDLCVVTTDIPEGGTITLNTNCVKSTVGRMLFVSRVIDKDVVSGVENVSTISSQYCQKIGRLVSITIRCRFQPLATGELTIGTITDDKWLLVVAGHIPIQVYNSTIGEIRNGLLKQSGEINYIAESNDVGETCNVEFNLVYNAKRSY